LIDEKGPGRISGAFLLLPDYCRKNLWDFSDKRFAACRAHNLCAIGAQIPHLQAERYFSPRACRGEK
jgi:hypothetical protein